MRTCVFLVYDNLKYIAGFERYVLLCEFWCYFHCRVVPDVDMTLVICRNVKNWFAIKAFLLFFYIKLLVKLLRCH